jgi:hypothetical protein
MSGCLKVSGVADWYRVTNCWFLNVRQAPDPGSPPARAAVPRGTRLDPTGVDPVVLSDGSVWVQVTAPDGSVGWVNKRFVEIVSNHGDVLSAPELYEVVRRHSAGPGLDHIVVAAALTESSGNRFARGDLGADGIWHSYGLWQLHDGQGIGGNMSAEDRCDPDKACDRILPVFRSNYSRFKGDQLTGEELAVHTYLATERPRGWTDPHGAAATRFRECWQDLSD